MEVIGSTGPDFEFDRLLVRSLSAWLRLSDHHLRLDWRWPGADVVEIGSSAIAVFRHLWRWQAPARLDRLALRTNAVLDLTTVQKSGSGYVADARETAAAAAAGEFEASKKRKRLLSAESWHQLSFLNMTISHKKKKKNSSSSQPSELNVYVYKVSPDVLMEANDTRHAHA